MSKTVRLFIAWIGLAVCPVSVINAQGGVSVNTTGSPPDNSAALDINFNNKGFLIPRLTTGQRDSIANPALSLMIFNTTSGCFECWANGLWQTMWCLACPTPAQPSVISGDTLPCQGTSQTYSVTLVSGVIYTWTFPAGWTQTAGGTTNSVTVTVDSGSGNIQVVPSNTYCGNGPAQTLAATSITAPPAPTAGADTASQTQIVWNWNAASEASGYKYGTIDNYSEATDNGTSTSFTQTGLTCDTTYTLYVWAYNSCGNSTATILRQTTSGCCSHGSQTFAYTGAQQTFTLQTCITSVTIDAYGAQGGCTGGLGGEITGILSVTPGQALNIYVGGYPGQGYQGGFNGGGNGGPTYPAYGGGGASDVRIGGTALSNRVIIAGGGGGYGQSCTTDGGIGGGVALATNGNDQCSGGTGGFGNGGTNGSNGSSTGAGGQGGQSSRGGGGGGGYTSGGGGGVGGGENGFAGSLGQGGAGGDYPSCPTSGGGGGGGYYGGGGGASGGCGVSAGGGGGSSATIGTGWSNVSANGGVQSSNGQVIITW